jgi:hypothetical protein
MSRVRRRSGRSRGVTNRRRGMPARGSYNARYEAGIARASSLAIPRPTSKSLNGCATWHAERQVAHPSGT